MAAPDFSKYQVIVVDFDGTLVDFSFRLSPAVKNSIKNLIQKGYIFSIATGRPYQGIVQTICGSLQLSSPQIVRGGAEIIDPKHKRILWAEYIPVKTAKEIINFFIDHNHSFAVESGEFTYTLDSESRQDLYGAGTVFKSLSQLDYQLVPKIVLDITSANNQDELEEQIKNLFPDLHIVKSGVHRKVLDITSEKATKHLAVLKLSELLNIDPKLMIGIGDGYNDYPLLSACGFKVAMENAPQQLKEIADLVVPTVENDGLLVIFNKLLHK